MICLTISAEYDKDVALLDDEMSHLEESLALGEPEWERELEDGAVAWYIAYTTRALAATAD
jgi:hypothetical protein